MASVPDHVLPAIKSSVLQANTRATARAATLQANGAFGPKVSKPTSIPARVEETTLGSLMARVKKGAVDENAFDPGAYLRRTGARIPRPTGAGLAGAALKKLGKR